MCQTSTRRLQVACKREFKEAWLQGFIRLDKRLLQTTTRKNKKRLFRRKRKQSSEIVTYRTSILTKLKINVNKGEIL